MVENVEYLSPLGKSDHSMLQFDIICTTSEKNPKISVQYEKGDYEKMLKVFKDIDWVGEFEKYPNDIEKQWNFFKEKYHDIEGACVPRKNVFVNGKLNKKLSTPLDQKNLRLLKRKNKLWGKVRKDLATTEEK